MTARDNQAMRRAPRRQRGFSMVEALVALVVLSVGMLGIASLYIVTLRSSGSAMSRMQAINLASDLGDRIRANRNAGASYAGAPAPNGTVCLGAAATCSPDQMAAHDLFVWQAQIQAALPGSPAGTVGVAGATAPRTYTITVSWTEAGETTPQSYIMRMQI